MNHPLLAILIAAFFLLISCNSGQQKQIIPVEKEFPLDSSVIGVSTIATGLDVPWEITWGPDNWIWLTEQKGVISKINPQTGEKKILLNVPFVYKERTLGLLGMAVYPDFDKYPYVFFDYTFLRDSSRFSRIVRYTYSKDTLINPLVLLDNIPGNTGHNGSRITITPDGKLLVSTGDALNGENAQNKNSINGKVLRINIDGTIPGDNPFQGSPVWSLGHRNIQGLAYGPNGVLYSSEHGDATDDEINIIEKGKNYGWPEVEGYCDLPPEKAYNKKIAITEPARAWTPTIAPAGIDFYHSAAIPEWQNALLLTTLKNNSLYVLKLDSTGKVISSEKIFLDHIYGRLRDVCISPSGDIYLSTSNRDWNPGEGFPKEKDDRIIRISKLRTENNHIRDINPIDSTDKPYIISPTGSSIYKSYCASCHKENGEGIAGNFPPLTSNPVIAGDKKRLISIILSGMSGPTKVKGIAYSQNMPSFSFLSDKDIAAVLTYIRTGFNNKANNVSSNEIALMRKNKKGK